MMTFSVDNILNMPDRYQYNETVKDILENFNTLQVHMRCARHMFNLVASKVADAFL